MLGNGQTSHHAGCTFELIFYRNVQRVSKFDPEYKFNLNNIIIYDEAGKIMSLTPMKFRGTNSIFVRGLIILIIWIIFKIIPLLNAFFFQITISHANILLVH